MGGSKSKPIGESAKSVLAKRKLNPLPTLERNVDISIDPRMVAKEDVNALDIEVLNEISKWSSVKSEYEKYPKVNTYNKDMPQIVMRTDEQEMPATMIRLAEEKRMTAITYEIPRNRLSEEHLTEMLKKFRGNGEEKDPQEITDIAAEYKIDAEIAAIVNKYVKAPLFGEYTKTAEDNKGSFLAR
jgi:hypothetical protein